MKKPFLRDGRRSFRDLFAAICSFNLIGTILALLLEAISNPDEVSVLGSHFIHSFVYANYIGTLVAIGVLALTSRLARISFPVDWALLVITILLLAFAGTAAAAATLIAVGSFPRDFTWLEPRRMSMGFLLALIWGSVVYGYERGRLHLDTVRRALHEGELDRSRAEQLAAQASLSSLESRIRPHFLFNTLNSVASLIRDDPAAAERMVERLAALLRFSLDASHGSTVALGLELKIAIDYLEIEKTRVGDRLRFAVDVPFDLHTIAVPPFAIQTLVENAVKHAVSGRRSGGELQLRAARRGGMVTIEVFDNGDGFNADAIAPGHGLDNLRSRLTALFGDAAALQIGRSEGRTLVAISLPATERAA